MTSRTFLPPTNSLHAPLKKLEEQLTCPVCLDFIIDPRTLPCLHSFCRECLFNLSQDSSSSIACPSCRQRINLTSRQGVNDLPVAFHLNNLKEIHTNLMRNVVSRTNVICDNCAMARDISYCKECGHFYCQNCIDDHVTTGHDFDSLGAESMSLSSLVPQTLPARQEWCTTHYKVLDIYCEKCQLVICMDCRRSPSHERHQCDRIEESYLRQCTTLQSHMSCVDDKIESINTTVEARLKKEHEVKEQGEEAKAEIRALVEGVVNVLNETAAKLINEVETMTADKLEKLKEQKKSTKKALRQLKDFKEFVSQCLETGTFQQILSSTNQMKQRLDHVTRHDVNDFLPISQSNIEFVPNQELKILAENIGEIISTDSLQKCQVKRIPTRSYLPDEEEISLNVMIEQAGTSSAVFNAPVSAISCNVIPPIGVESEIVAKLDATLKPGVYNVNISPVFRGHHELNLTINDIQLDALQVTIPSDLHFLPVPTCVSIIDNFEYPYSLAISNSGDIIVSEPNNHCVKIIDKHVKSVKSFGSGDVNTINIDFSYPRGVTITPDNFILVTNDHGIVKLTINGSIIGVGGGEEGCGENEFNSPNGIAVSCTPRGTTDHVYIADNGNHRIQVLTSDLEFSHCFGSRGALEGQFEEPWDVVIDSQGYVYVTDSGNHRIQKFTHDGLFQVEFGGNILTSPAGIALSHTNQLYVTDRGSHCIFVFSLEGQLLSSFGIIGSDDNQFNCPGGIDFNGEGLLYVCDYFNKRIVVY